jgi:hypothetical protein
MSLHADARVVTRGHGKRVEPITPVRVLVFEQLAEGGEEFIEHVAALVQLARETAFVPRPLPPVALPVALGRRQIAAKEAGRDQGRGEHLRIGEVLARVGVGCRVEADGREQISDKALHCYGLFRQGRRARREASNTSTLRCSLRNRLFYGRGTTLQLGFASRLLSGEEAPSYSSGDRRRVRRRALLVSQLASCTEAPAEAVAAGSSARFAAPLAPCSSSAR